MDIKNYFKHIFSLAALLNIVIGFIFLFFSDKGEDFLFGAVVLPHYIWIILGAGFLYFAYWQIRSMAKEKTGRKTLIFALVMAWTPALAVTVILIIPVLPFAANGRLVFLVVDIYMILLGAYYFRLIRDSPDGDRTKVRRT